MLQLSSFQFSLNHILRTQQNISVILSQYDTNASKSSSRVFFPLKPSVSTFPLAFSCPVFPPAWPIELCFQDSRSSLAHSLKLSHVFQLVSELSFQGLIAAQAQPASSYQFLYSYFFSSLCPGMCLGVFPGTGRNYSDTRSLSGKERIYFYPNFQSGTESHGTSACFLSTPQCTAAASSAHTVKIGL